MKGHRVTALLVVAALLLAVNAATLYYAREANKRSELAIVAIYGDESAREDAADQLVTSDTERILGDE